MHWKSLIVNEVAMIHWLKFNLSIPQTKMQILGHYFIWDNNS